MTDTGTIHASAVLVGTKAVLIRGPSGSGKSRLAWALLEASLTGALGFGRLVADDRASVEAIHGRLIVRPAPELVGLIEMRGLGIRKLPYEPVAVVGWLVDLFAEDAARLPETMEIAVAGVTLPRLAVARGANPLPPVLAALRTSGN